MDLSVSNSTVIIALNSTVMRLNIMNAEELDSKLIIELFKVGWNFWWMESGNFTNRGSPT